jgi:glycosyltransferase involved in cell wall biosynthesis
VRITALYIEGNANTYYRVLLPLRELERRGHEVLWPAKYRPAQLFAGKPRFDALLMHHFHDEEHRELVHRLRCHGVATVWDTDDDLSAMPKHDHEYKSYGRRRGIRRTAAEMVEVARAASLMTTPSAHLAQRYRERGVEQVEVIENHVAPEHVGGPRPRRQGVVIGITAAREHAEDLKRLRIARVLSRLVRAHPGTRIVTIGLPLDLTDERYEARSPVPIQQLVATESLFEIGLAPLCDTPFNRARSNVKLKEYAAAGAMWLASPVGPYAELGEEHGGLLVDDDAWFDVLDELVQDYRRRLELMERARAWARRQSADHAVKRWEAAFQRAMRQVRA